MMRSVIMSDELDLFDDLLFEVGEEETVDGHEVVDNVLLADKLKAEGKVVAEKTFKRDVVYPYFEICLTAESQVNTITLEAINQLLSVSVVKADTREEVNDILEDGFSSVTVGVSTDTTLTPEPQERVLGTVQLSKIRYLYSLVRNINTRLHYSKDLVFEGSKILALV